MLDRSLLRLPLAGLAVIREVSPKLAQAAAGVEVAGEAVVAGVLAGAADGEAALGLGDGGGVGRGRRRAGSVGTGGDADVHLAEVEESAASRKAGERMAVFRSS